MQAEPRRAWLRGAGDFGVDWARQTKRARPKARPFRFFKPCRRPLDFIRRGNLEALAVLLAEHFVGFFVVGEAVLGGVEFEHPAAHQGDVAQVRHAGGEVGGFDGAVLIGRLTAAHRLDEVFEVLRGGFARGARLLLAAHVELILGVAADRQVKKTGTASKYM